MNLAHVSVSTIDGFAECPRRAYLRKTLTVPDKVESPFTAVGNAAHEVLEIYHTPARNGRSMREIFNEVAKKYALTHHERYMDTLKYLEIYEDAYKITYSDKPEPLVVGTEVEFFYDVGPYKMRGFIDKIEYHGDGKYKVVDYKAGFVKKDKNEVARDFQLISYDIAVRELWKQGAFIGLPEPEEVECELYFLRHGPISATFTQEDRDSILSYIEYMAGLIEMITEEPPPRISPYCYYCDFKGNCTLYNSDFSEFLATEELKETDELVERLAQLRHIAKATKIQIGNIQKNLISRLEFEQKDCFETETGTARLSMSTAPRYNYDVIKASLPQWTEYANPNVKAMYEELTDEEKEVVDDNTYPYRSSPFIRITKARK